MSELDDALSDPDVIGALKALAEQHANAPGPLCPRCARREVNRKGDFCHPCDIEVEDERAEAIRASKRRWWRKHGKEWRKKNA